jgi:inhibitor of cysteine peptidase
MPTYQCIHERRKSMKIASIIAVALFGVGLVLGLGCGGTAATAGPTPTQTPTGQEVWVTEEDSGGTVTIGMADSLIVALDSNPTTGFSWTLVYISDGVVTNVSNEYIPNPTPTGEPIVGSGGEEIWTFAPQAAGISTIEMMYSRPWESVEPAARFNITVTVE